MSKKKTPSFTFELPLKITPHDEKVLEIRLDQGRLLYNSCLSEGLKRLDLMRESKLYGEAVKCKDKKEKAKLFKSLRAKFGISDNAIQAVATKNKNACSIGKNVDAATCQKIGTRAFKAIEEHMYGKRGRPRFKGKGRFRSLESKSNASGIRFKDGKVEWKGLKLTPIFDRKDKHGVEAHALSCRTKYVRLVRKKIKGKTRWYVQLIQEGLPLIKEKNKIESGAVVGLDIGPSTIAVVGDDDAFLTAFVPEIQSVDKTIRLIQRKMDRSRRANNPDNYNSDKTVKKGKKSWKRSKKYIKLQNTLAEKQRCLAEIRKTSHGQLINKILSFGNIVKTEKLSYKAFQKLFGKSVGKRAPGEFMKRIRFKAGNAGGVVEEFSTYTTKLSQVCHQCETYKKKKLSTRVHTCDCGIKPVQRDLYSGFLARHVEKDSLIISQAQEAWATAERLLERAMLRLKQTASGQPRLSSFGLGQRQSGSHVKGESEPTNTTDVVAYAPA